jgi:hypothetical protein
VGSSGVGWLVRLRSCCELKFTLIMCGFNVRAAAIVPGFHSPPGDALEPGCPPRRTVWPSRASLFGVFLIFTKLLIRGPGTAPAVGCARGVAAVLRWQHTRGREARQPRAAPGRSCRSWPTSQALVMNTGQMKTCTTEAGLRALCHVNCVGGRRHRRGISAMRRGMQALGAGWGGKRHAPLLQAGQIRTKHISSLKLSLLLGAETRDRSRERGKAAYSARTRCSVHGFVKDLTAQTKCRYRLAHPGACACAWHGTAQVARHAHAMRWGLP